MRISTLTVAIMGTFALSGCGSDEPYQEVKKERENDLRPATQRNQHR